MWTCRFGEILKFLKFVRSGNESNHKL